MSMNQISPSKLICSMIVCLSLVVGANWPADGFAQNVAAATDQANSPDTDVSPTSANVAFRPYDFDKHGGVVYRRGEDFELSCDIYVPIGNGPFPALLAVHGGGWWSGSKLHWFRHARHLARAGYVVVAINYRHAPKYKFPAQIHDCKAAVRWMRNNAEAYKIDPHRIGGVGYSAGGHLVALLGTTDADDGLEGVLNGEEPATSTRLQAVVAGGAPCDFGWIEDDSTRLVYWLGATPAADPDIYRRAAPTSFISDDDPPFAFYHGESDFVVPPSASETMHLQLQRRGLPSHYKLLAGQGHLGAFTDLETMDFAIEFFDRHLTDRHRTDKKSR